MFTNMCSLGLVKFVKYMPYFKEPCLVAQLGKKYSLASISNKFGLLVINSAFIYHSLEQSSLMEALY